MMRQLMYSACVVGVYQAVVLLRIRLLYAYWALLLLYAYWVLWLHHHRYNRQ